jgi:hypothetical protein
MCFVYVAAFWITLEFGASAFADQCNPTFVQENGQTITVLPTGLDDTANLQCAFDNAVTIGPGVTVRLVEGTYHTRQIVVNNFRGAFTGAGGDKSVLTNLPNLYVTPVDNSNNLPSAKNPWPSLVSFVGGDFLVSDLGMRITGDKPTTGWTISLFPGPTFYELAIGFAVLGTKANALFLCVNIEGEPAMGTLYGYNLINGIYFEGLGIGPITAALPISGSFTVRAGRGARWYRTTSRTSPAPAFTWGRALAIGIVAGNSNTAIQNLGTDNVIVNKGSAP